MPCGLSQRDVEAADDLFSDAVSGARTLSDVWEWSESRNPVGRLHRSSFPRSLDEVLTSDQERCALEISVEVYYRPGWKSRSRTGRPEAIV